jgi:secondary thiamine-phosphate synthase enzyme
MHLVTSELLPELTDLRRIRIGMLHLFLQHTSASLTLNENADPSVRSDFERWLTRAVPDGAPYFAHDAEGPDDMPAHLKSSLLGTALTIPVSAGQLALGTWQGIYLGEHRADAPARSVVATLWGEA